MLAENGRLADVELISSKFEELMMASRGEVKAVVTSAEVRANQPYRDCGNTGLGGRQRAGRPSDGDVDGCASAGGASSVAGCPCGVSAASSLTSAPAALAKLTAADSGGVLQRQGGA